MRRCALLAAGAALALAPAATAKYRITLALSAQQPRVSQLVVVRIGVDVPPSQAGTLRLVLVPPRVGIYTALRDEAHYRVPLVRSGTGWRAVVRFTRRGTWQLVVPNWGAPGYAIPPPVIRAVRVR
jgi:hypothetical protein